MRLARTIANHLASATIRTMARRRVARVPGAARDDHGTVDEGVIVQSGRRQNRLRKRRRRPGGRLRQRCQPSSPPTGRRCWTASSSSTRRATTARRRAAGSPRAPRRVVGARRAVPHPRDGRGALVDRPCESVHGADGGVEIAISVIHDITENDEPRRRAHSLPRPRERAAERDTRLSRARSAALADIAVPAFAGHVDRRPLRRRRAPLRRRRACRSGEDRADDRDCAGQYPPTVAEHPVQRALRTGEAQLVPDVQAEADDDGARRGARASDPRARRTRRASSCR